MVASGCANAASIAAVQPPSTATAPPRSASSSASTSGRKVWTCARTGVPIGGAGRGVRVAPSASTAPPTASSPPAWRASTARRAASDTIDDDRGKRVTSRRLDRGLPAGIDLHQIEQRADHTVEVGQSLGTRPGARVIEGEAQGLRPSRPRMAIAVGGAQRRLGVRDLLLRRRLVAAPRPPGAGRGDPLQPRPPPPRRGAGRPRRRAGPASRRGWRGGTWPRSSSCAPRSTPDRSAASSPRLFRGAAGQRGHAIGPVALEGGARLCQRSFGAGQLVALRRQRGGLGVRVGELGRQASGLRLEGCDHRLVDERAALAIDPAPTLGEHGYQPPGLLAQRLEAHQRVAEVVAAGVTELRFRGEDRGVELRKRAAEQVVLGGAARPEPRCRRRAGGSGW